MDVVASFAGGFTVGRVAASAFAYWMLIWRTRER